MHTFCVIHSHYKSGMLRETIVSHVPTYSLLALSFIGCAKGISINVIKRINVKNKSTLRDQKKKLNIEILFYPITSLEKTQ